MFLSMKNLIVLDGFKFITYCLVSFGLGILVLTGCDFDQTEVIQRKVQENVNNFRKKHYAECQAILLYDAEKIVDSLLLTEALAALRDSLQQDKPYKPVQPPEVPPIDSLEVQPIFKK